MNELTKANLTMNFDARDVVDVLVSEQEQNLENQLDNLKLKLTTVIDEREVNDKSIEVYKKEFVSKVFGDKILTISNAFKDINVNATVRIEIIDGCDLPGRRRIALTMNPEHQDRESKIVVALIICNKDMDHNTIDSTITFYLEHDYDEKLKELKNIDEKLATEQKQLIKNIKELENTLSKTDRLARKAKAAITKKAISEDMNVFLDDFKKNYLEETDFKKIEQK